MSRVVSEPGALAAYVRALVVLLVLIAVGSLALPATLGGRTAYVIVAGESMEPRYHTYDLVVMRATGAYEVGDLVTYRVPQGDPGAGSQVIHRIVGGNGTDGYVTRGDNKPSVDRWSPTDGDVVGEEWFAIPQAGRWMLWFRQPHVFGALMAAIVVALVVGSGEEPQPRPRRRRARAAAGES